MNNDAARRAAIDSTIALAFAAGYHETREEMRTATYTRIALRRRSEALCAVEHFGGWDVTMDGVVVPLSTNRSSRVNEVLAPALAATQIMRGMKRASS